MEPFPFDPQQPPQNGQKYSPAEKRGCVLLALIALLLLIAGVKIVHTPWLFSVLFGVMFLAVGWLALRQARQSPKPQYRMTVTCAAIGAFAFINGILILLRDKFGISVLPESQKGSDSVTGAVFTGAGLGIIAFALAGLLHKKRWCTEPVEAVCVDLAEVRSSRHRTQVPVYEYFYGGTTHLIRGSVGTTFANPKIGDVVKMYIDPTYLDEYYEPKRDLAVALFPMLFGLAIAAVGLWLMLH